MRDLVALAGEHPVVFDQLCCDMRLAAEREADGRRPGWMERGERPEDARDRLRAEREAARERYGA